MRESEVFYAKRIRHSHSIVVLITMTEAPEILDLKQAKITKEQWVMEHVDSRLINVTFSLFHSNILRYDRIFLDGTKRATLKPDSPVKRQPYSLVLGEEAVSVVCPICNKRGTTAVSHACGAGSWRLAMYFAVCGMCLCPLCCNQCKQVLNFPLRLIF